jgi:hypothetical protein
MSRQTGAQTRFELAVLSEYKARTLRHTNISQAISFCVLSTASLNDTCRIKIASVFAMVTDNCVRNSGERKYFLEALGTPSQIG